MNSSPLQDRLQRGVGRALAGASFFYHPGAVPYEAQEVRAYGLMLCDLVDRICPEDAASDLSRLLRSVRDECLATPWMLRPSFATLQSRLSV
jgi:hypothetical protein